MRLVMRLNVIRLVVVIFGMRLLRVRIMVSVLRFVSMVLWVRVRVCGLKLGMVWFLCVEWA